MHGKARDFKLHMTKSILFLILQVCSVFYLATNTNGTIRGLFYHLFSVIYASLFFAVCFVETLERLAKTYQFLKIFMAVIQDHLDIDIGTLLTLYNVICCIALHFCKLRTDFGFFCSVNHFSEGGVNANHNVTCLLSLAENDSESSRIAKEIAMVSGFFDKGRRQTLLYSCKWQEWERS